MRNAGAAPDKCLRVEFSVAPQTAESGLVSAGLLIANPPWTLAADLKVILPELEKPLGLGGAGRYRIEIVRP
jgi:23S rRNA (adenine2030-N6)-methyltransferase